MSLKLHNIILSSSCRSFTSEIDWTYSRYSPTQAFKG